MQKVQSAKSSADPWNSADEDEGAIDDDNEEHQRTLTDDDNRSANIECACGYNYLPGACSCNDGLSADGAAV